MKKVNRTYSRYTLEALSFFAKLLKETRIKSFITTADLAARAGISRDLLYRIENADPACSVGVIFEIASLLEVQLFNSDIDDMKMKNKIITDKIALLPKKIKVKKMEVDDDF